MKSTSKPLSISLILLILSSLIPYWAFSYELEPIDDLPVMDGPALPNPYMEYESDYLAVACAIDSCEAYERCYYNEGPLGEDLSYCGFSEEAFIENINLGNIDIAKLATAYPGSPSTQDLLMQALSNYLQNEFHVGFSLDEEIPSGIIIKEGVMYNNGQELKLEGLNESYTGFSAYQEKYTYYENGNPLTGIRFGFSFVGKNGEVNTVVGAEEPLSLEDGSFVVGDSTFSFGQEGGVINFAYEGKVKLINGEFHSGEDTIFGNSEFHLNHDKSIDYTQPVTVMGDISYACLREECARAHTEGIDLITDYARDFQGGLEPKTVVCVECDPTLLAQLDSAVEAGGIGGYIFWDQQLNSGGDLGDHAVARGKILATFNKEIIEGYHQDIVFDALDEGAEVDDIGFTFLGERGENSDFDGEVGRILNGDDVIVLDKQYECQKRGFLGIGCPDGIINSGMHALSIEYGHGGDTGIFQISGSLEDTTNAVIPLGLFNNLGWSPQRLAEFWNSYEAARKESCPQDPNHVNCVPSTDDNAVMALLFKEQLGSLTPSQQLDAMALIGNVDGMMADPNYNVLENVMAHHESFKTSPDGDQVDVENLYVMTSDGNVMVSQEAVHESVFDFWLNNKYLKQAYVEYANLVASGQADIDPESYVQQRMSMLEHEMWFESQRHELNGWIEFMDDSNWDLKSNINGAIFDREGAFEELRTFNSKIEGMEQIDSLLMQGKTLQEIYEGYVSSRDGDSSISAAFSDPGLRFDLGKEQMLTLAMGGGGVYQIPNCEGSECSFRIPEQINEAMLKYNNLVAQSYLESKQFDQAKQYYTQGILLSSSSSLTNDELQQVFEHIDEATFRSDGGIYYPPEIKELIDSGKLSADQINQIIGARIAESQYKTQVGITKFLTNLVPDTYLDVALTLIGTAKVAQEGFIATKAAYLALGIGEIGTSRFVATMGKGLVNVFASMILGLDSGVMGYDDLARGLFREGQTIKILMDEDTVSDGWKILNFLDDGTVRVISEEGIERVVSRDMINFLNTGDSGALLLYFSKIGNTEQIGKRADELMALDKSLSLDEALRMAKGEVLQELIIKQEEIKYVRMLQESNMDEFWQYFSGKVDEDTVAFINKQQAVYDHAMDDLATMFANAEVTGRIKDPVHLEEKIFRDWAAGGISRDEFYAVTNPLDMTIKDVVGTRITVDSIDEMQEVAAVLQSKIDSREWLLINTKDYITNPKAGYRSIHYQVVIDDVPVEIQIRTPGQTIWADWAHDVVYKGPYTNVAEVQEYAVQTGDWVYSMDSSVQSSFAIECPACPSVLVEANLCFPC